MSRHGIASASATAWASPEHRARPDNFLAGTTIQGGQQVQIREPPGEPRVLERVHLGQVYAMAREDPEHRIKLCRQREREYRTDTQGVPRLPGDDMQGGDEAERQQRHLEDLPTRPPVRGEHTEANGVPDCANLLRWNKKYTILALHDRDDDKETTLFPIFCRETNPPE